MPRSLNMTDQVRKLWAFYRDRRPDSYDAVGSPFLLEEGYDTSWTATSARSHQLGLITCAAASPTAERIRTLVWWLDGI